MSGYNDAFDGIEKAERSKGGLYLSAGTYADLEIVNVKMITSRKGIDLFTVELLVHKSEGEKAIRSGLRPAWQVKRTSDNFLTDVREFVAEAAGCEFQEVDAAGVRAVLGKDGLVPTISRLAGVHLSASAYDKATKGGGNFTKVMWERWPAAKLKSA